MILSTAADAFKLPISIAGRIRLVFLFYALISVAAAVLVYVAPNPGTSFDIVYKILFPIGVISCLAMAWRPTIGDGSLYLLPLFVGSCVRVADFWFNYLSDDLSLEVVTRASVGWSFLLVSIAYVDLLESRIYHRMVNYIEQKSE